ncbi:hypothetical protein ACFWN1_05870 [Streptomyces sp. NPDC058459]|uniref:hypothetical protein n=1 Tax=Streptomyces sp. NPDC058459 TaxID=3346508 RepID=UPI0036545080
MAFPQTPLDTRIDLQIGGVWTDITPDVYTANAISIERGRPDEAPRTDPGSCKLEINNRSGRYSPRNPRSPLYGLIGRNTPLRVSVPGPTSYLDLDGTAVNNASTPSAAALNLTGDLDVRWEGEADWNSAGAQMLIGKWGAAGNRSYHLRLQTGQLWMHFSTDGTTGYSAGRVLPALPARAAVRGTVDVDNGAGGITIRLYTAASLAGPWTEIGAYTIGTPSTVFVSTAPLTIAPQQLDLATPPRQAVTGRCYRAEVRNGIDGPLVAAPDFTAQSTGTSAFTDSAGRAWTVNGTAVISSRRVRFTGEVSSWPSRWDVSGKDIRVPVEAAGVLRRYGQGAKPLESTLRRRLPSGSPLAYWPLEDGASSSQASSGISGGRPLRVSGMTFGGDAYPPGSGPLPSLGSSASMDGRVTGAKPGGWHVEMVYRLPTLPATEQTMLTLTLAPGTGGVAQVACRVSVNGVRVQCLDGDGTVLAFFLYTDAAATAAFAGVWNRLQVFSSVSGSTTTVSVSWRDVITNAWRTSSTSYTGTPGTLTGVRNTWAAAFQSTAIGHLAAWDIGGTTATTPGVTTFDRADDAYSGETAGSRMIRLSGEETIPLTVYGQTNTEEPLGPQKPDTLLNLLEEAADVDGGILYERRDRLGLVYRDRASMYNQTPALVLDYNTPGHVAPPLEPLDDDQPVRNDITVTREGGASARVTLDTGTLSTQAPPNGVGVYDEAVTLNLYTDDQALQQAGWRLLLRTVDEARYPVVNIDLAAAPSLVDKVTALDSGDRIRILNPPPWLPPGPIDLIVQGYSESIGHPNDWNLSLNCTPASPWTIAETAILEDFEDTVYDIPLTAGGNQPWARSQTRAQNGSWSLRSGTISNNQTSDATATVPPGATVCSFWYWVSSETAGTGFEGDRLLVLVDGVQALRAQGTIGWTYTTLDVTGANTVTFRYTKDNSGAAGEDCAHLDDLAFHRAPTRVDTDGSSLAAAVTSAATTLTVATNTGPPWITSAAYPADFPFEVQAAGERMRVTAVVPAVTDTFGRTLSSSWGTTDSGETWTTSGGSASDHSVASGTGRHSQASINISRWALLASPMADVDLVVSASTSVLAAGGPHYVGLVARAADVNNLYYARLAFNTDQTVTLVLQRRIAAGQTDLASATMAGAHAANTPWRMRFQVQGSTLRARAWRASDPEPASAWHVVATDTSLTAAGSIGVRTILSSANTNTLPVVAFYDDVALLNLQKFTVTRAVNGIVKAQNLGADLRLAHTAWVAL